MYAFFPQIIPESQYACGIYLSFVTRRVSDIFLIHNCQIYKHRYKIQKFTQFFCETFYVNNLIFEH